PPPSPARPAATRPDPPSPAAQTDSLHPPSSREASYTGRELSHQPAGRPRQHNQRPHDEGPGRHGEGAALIAERDGESGLASVEEAGEPARVAPHQRGPARRRHQQGGPEAEHLERPRPARRGSRTE